MGKKSKYAAFRPDRYRPRSASGPAAGPVLLACEKCKERLAKEGRFRQIAQMQQALGEIADDADAKGTGLRILPVSCLDVCPRGAMAVALGASPGRGPATTVIVRTPAELREVCDELVQRHQALSADAQFPASDTQSLAVSRDPLTSSQDNS